MKVDDYTNAKVKATVGKKNAIDLQALQAGPLIPFSEEIRYFQ